MPRSTPFAALVSLLFIPAIAHAQRVAPDYDVPAAAPGAHRTAADFVLTRVPTGAPLFPGRLDGIAPVDSGFIGGTNVYGDIAKGTALNLPAGVTSAQLTSVDVVFAYKRPGLTTQTFALEIYAGTPDSGPTGAPIATASFPYSAVNAPTTFPPPGNLAATRLTLPSAVTVPSVFFVMLNFITADDPGRIGVAKTATVAGRNAHVWEKWSDNSWHNLSDAWYSNAGDFGTGTSGWELAVSANVSTGTAVERGIAPDGFGLRLAGANPVAGETALVYSLPRSGPAHLAVYDVLGREVARLADGAAPAGASTATFDASGLAAGLYVVRLRAEGRTAVLTLVVR